MKRLFLILLFLPMLVNGQIITTYAGGGTIPIPDPIGGVFDKYDNYYCAGGDGNIVCKVSNTGIITTIAGNSISGFSGDSSLATSAELHTPTSVKLDTAGNFYICDANNNRIRKVDAITGIITTIVGGNSAGFGGDNGPAISATLNDPQDICFDKWGNLYIADMFNHRIRKVDISGIITTIAGIDTPGYSGDNGPATAAKIRAPSGLAIDDTGNLYIAGGNVVRRINSLGIISTVAGVDGSYIYPGDGILAINAGMCPIKIAIDPFGQLVIADNNNDRVFRINNAGVIYTVAGNGIAGFSGDNGPAIEAEFHYPAGVVFDSCGNLYITDVDAGRVRKVSFNPACWPEKVNNIVATNSLTIFPNPATTSLTIQSPTQPITQITITNLFGQTVYNQPTTANCKSLTVDVSGLPNGMYFVKINDSDPSTSLRMTYKFAKE